MALGRLWVALGRLLGTSWSLLGASWALLGASWPGFFQALVPDRIQIPSKSPLDRFGVAGDGVLEGFWWDLGKNLGYMQCAQYILTPGMSVN